MSAAQVSFDPSASLWPGAGARIHGLGEMSTLIREHDWGTTPLGPLHRWPDALTTAVNLILCSPIASSLYWGCERILIYNDGYRKFVAERHPNALGRPGAEVWREAWHIVGPQIEHTFRTAEPFQDETALVPIVVEGRMVDHYWNYSFSPVYGSGAGVAGVYNTCVNATESFRVSKERNALSQRLQEVLEATSDGVVSIDRDWRLTYMNERARRIHEPLNFSVGITLWEALPELVEGTQDFHFLHRAMDHGEQGEFESVYREPLNHCLRVQVRPAPDGIVVFLSDITGQKRSALALQKAVEDLTASEEELRWTVKMSTQNPWTADAAGRLLTADEGLEVTGVAKENLLGERWIDVVHPEDAEAMALHWAQCVATGELYEFEFRMRIADAEYRWFRARAFPRRDTQGRIVKWYGNSEDIHTRKQAEEALRTTEKLAAVGRLATSIAHEINNPLEAVTNLLYLARTSEEFPESLDYIRQAERELHRASVITNQTLRFQRQSSGSVALDSQDLIENCLAVFQGKLQNSSVTPERRLRARRPVTCYDGEIRQVFLNLVGNAIDAMQPQGGRLVIRTREATHPKSGKPGLVLTVTDTGTGISEETRAKLFAPFFTTKGLNGTGLGLWVSLEIVARHHGALRLRSRPRRRKTDGNEASGTVFTLFLPFDAAVRHPVLVPATPARDAVAA